MVRIRPFIPSDNDALLDIEKLSPHGNDKVAMVTNLSPDITARYELYDNWKIMVAEEHEQIAGYVGWTVKHGPLGPYVYLTEVMVDPAFRRKGIAIQLIREMEKHAEDIKSSYIYCHIYGPNEPYRKLTEKLGYIREKEITICEISTTKKEKAEKKYSIDHIDGSDLPEAVGLINQYYAGRTHFIPFTPESFRDYTNRILGYGLENFIVAKYNGTIVACGGFWDTAVLVEMAYTREPLLWKLMANMQNMLRHFTRIPLVPKEGEYFKFRNIVNHAFKPGHPDAMVEIFEHCSSLMYETKCDFFGTYIDPVDPLFELLKVFRPHLETEYIYAKPIAGKLPDFSTFYVDCRDTIL
ncbi:N-acetyltransferase family protein [Methanomethylovorans sp.]|uniref:GNAT family N-acetyltransferase n=1 Tax=Methanomethylovorans sp. TaxID=2758717 RepID=UPI003D0BDA4B